MKEKEFDFLMAFKKYRNLKDNHRRILKDNRILKKNWEQQIIINDNLKDKLKSRNKTIFQLRKNLKEYERRNSDANGN